MATTFLYEQAFGRMKPVTVPLDGRTVIVTGANTGLGLQTAFHLASLSPAKLILAVRSTDKGDKARETILEAAKVGVDAEMVVEVWQLDLASFSSVKAFAARAEAELHRLDILVENAGVVMHDWTTTPDGWETTLQVNVLSTGLLGLLLIPLLRRTAGLGSPVADSKSPPFKPHLTLVGSEVHHFATFHEATLPGPVLLNLNDEETFKKTKADRYNVSKLLDIHISLGLATLAGDEVIVNVVNPGLCISEFRRNFTGILPYLLNAASRTAEQGSLNIAWAATADTSAVKGAYVSVQSIKETSSYTHTEAGHEVEKRVWDELMAVWGEVATEQVHLVLESL